jgi:serine/threonine-protein kinase HipA
MSVGKSRHYAFEEILPRHFIQTAEISGVGAHVVYAIFADLVENFETAFTKVQKALPKGFPEKLVNSIRVAATARIKQISGT